MEIPQTTKPGDVAASVVSRPANYFLITLLGVLALGGMWIILFLRFVSYQVAPTTAQLSTDFRHGAGQTTGLLEEESTEPNGSLQGADDALAMGESESLGIVEGENGPGRPVAETEPFQTVPLPQGEGPSSAVPRIAFVVDDWGYGLDAFETLERERVPLTLAILPQTPHSQEIALRAKAAGFEVILHLPMEPMNGDEPRSPGRLTMSMAPEEIAAVMRADLETVPYAVGISNHQGSKATQNREFMSHVMECVSEWDLYFLDSRTSPRTVAAKVGREYGVRTASNRLFIDNVIDPEYIRGQIERLISIAKRSGSAIGILHAHVVSMTTLVEMLPELEDAGIELVYASELVE